MARTRKDVRLTKLIQTRESLLDAILNAYDLITEKCTKRYLDLMGRHLKEIGTLAPSDIHRLEVLRKMNFNLREVERYIARELPRGLDELDEILDELAKTDTRIQALRMGKDYDTVAKNIGLTRILKAAHKETASTMANLSNTTVVNTAYKNAVDEAVWAVRSGAEDYSSTIRRATRQAGQFGLRTREKDNAQVVDYSSGHSRRLDSAVRMNILDGARHLNQTVMEQVGETFGADGIELDAHMLCADDHLPYQGRQYSKKVFEQIQDGLKRPFGEWNCRHTWSPIIMGISEPRYDQSDLDKMERNSVELVTIDGRTQTRYQWSQSMRAIETSIRRQKDTANLARASGDEELRHKCQGRINALQGAYRDIARQSGLKPEYERQNVYGFKDAK